MKIIARIRTDFKEKFGIPRQSGIAECTGKIVFEPEYRCREALIGIEGYSHLWLIWKFSEAEREEWSPTVRPPRLGGNKRVGVFATRSPFRPNPIGLSSVKLEAVEQTSDEGIVLIVSGADLLDGTPIYDIKPSVVYADTHVGVRSGFVDEKRWQKVEVRFPTELRTCFSDKDFSALCKVLELDPRPQYHNDPERVYGMPFAGRDVRFRVSNEGVLEVIDVKAEN